MHESTLWLNLCTPNLCVEEMCLSYVSIVMLHLPFYNFDKEIGYNLFINIGGCTALGTSMTIGSKNLQL